MRGFGYQLIGVGKYKGDLNSDNLKKLFITAKCDNIPTSFHKSHLSSCSLVWWKDVYCALSEIEGHIIGYERYKDLMDGNLNLSDYIIKLANVSYMYNFDGAEDDGYYWVDSYNNELITFIPPEPTREGYTFNGWYKESECINLWDFETDKTANELIVDYKSVPNYRNDYSPKEPPQYDENDGIKLYAKWIKK